MDSHEIFLHRLKDAARLGENLLRILTANRDHILHCFKCQQNLNQLEDEYYAVMLSEMENAGTLAKPAQQPRVSLDFLNTPSPSIWKAGEIPGEVGILILEKALKVKVDWGKSKTIFEGLSGGLAGLVQTQRYSEAAFRSAQGSEASWEEINLPDVEEGILIHLRVQPGEQKVKGSQEASLVVTVEAAGQPVDGVQVSIRSSQGSQVSITRQGSAVFDGLTPDFYAIDVRITKDENAGKRWRMRMSIYSSAVDTAAG